MGSRLSEFLEKNPNLKYVLLICVVAALANWAIVSKLNQLPTFLYGGDLYNHLGSVYHMYFGGSLFDNGQLAGEVPWVPWLYHIYILGFSLATGMDPMYGNIFSTIPLIFISGIVTYFILKRAGSERLLILAGVAIMMAGHPIMKYTPFSVVVVMPVVILALLLYMEKESAWRSVFLAAALAAGNLTNIQMAMAQYALFGLIALDYLLSSLSKNGKERSWSADLVPSVSKAVMKYGPVFALSVILSMPYWYGPVFMERLQTPNNLQIYGWPDFSRLSEQVSYPINIFVSNYFPSDPLFLAFGLVQIVGMWQIISRRNESMYLRFFYLMLFAEAILLVHHLLTYNLLHMQFAAERMFGSLATIMAPISIVIAGEYLMRTVEGRWKTAGRLVPLAIFLLAAATTAMVWVSVNGSPLYAGKEPLLPAPYLELKSWVINSTRVSDVFIATNEDAFMMNGLTGRKTVSYRRTHAPVYTDMDQRMMDQAVILQTQNSQLRTELLEKYGVKYVLWTNRWHGNEIMLENGSITAFYDPLMVPANDKYQAYLSRNNVQYITYYGMLDPAGAPNFPKYRLYVVVPIQNFEKPWVDDFDRRLTQVKQIPETGAPLFVIYKVNHGQ